MLLLFPVRYQNVKDLLSVESVCKFLSSIVRSDARLCRDIHIDRTASRERITNDALLQLANICPKKTDDGMICVLERNPRLIKLNVPGYMRLTVEGILNCLRNFKSRNTLPGGINQVRQYSLSYGDDDCAMDIELCPRCRFSQMDYDCSADNFQGKKVEPQSCQACRFFISRCYQYGRCINDVELQETFC
ncbi:hypothetical protein MKW98_014111 [Papaver atlanticum]|uniref:Uncharacterized protein n=1 Tax=Papaver atlanticum TaxID=357466 RepID=A0AAD4SLA5_9MAGN|nr:hypothetical protein MKW98_014111 [Papaver atlanticum]